MNNENNRMFDRIKTDVNIDSTLLDYIEEGFYVMVPQKPIDTSMTVNEQLGLIYELKITDCNDNFAQMYGYEDKQDLIGMSLTDFYGSNDNPENNAFLKEWISSNFEIYGSISEELDVNQEKVWFSNNIKGIIENGHMVKVYGVQTNVTSVKKSQIQLKKSEMNLKNILDGMLTHICIVDFEGKIIDVNKAFVELLGYQRSEIIGKTPVLFDSNLTDEIYQDILDKHLNDSNFVFSSETSHIGKDGTTYQVILSTNVIEYNDQIAVLASGRDISSVKLYEKNLKEANEMLKKLASTDELTGLDNRRKMMERLEDEVIRAKRSNIPFTVVLVDLDHFKFVNDTYGHEFGDCMLQQLSTLIKMNIREQDSVCRWGGDEFLLLLPQTDVKGAQIIIEKIRKIIEEHTMKCGQIEMHVTASFGIFEHNTQFGIDYTVSKADDAMYQSKDKGGNTVVVYND